MIKQLAGGIIINSDEELLAIHRATPELTQLELIGGEIESYDKSPEDALVREALEEANAHIKIVRELGVQSFMLRDVRYRQKLFLATAPAIRYYPQESKFDEVGWFRIAQLRQRDDLSVGFRLALKKIVDGEVSLSV